MIQETPNYMGRASCNQCRQLLNHSPLTSVGISNYAPLKSLNIQNNWINISFLFTIESINHFVSILQDENFRKAFDLALLQVRRLSLLSPWKLGQSPEKGLALTTKALTRSSLARAELWAQRQEDSKKNLSFLPYCQWTSKYEPGIYLPSTQLETFNAKQHTTLPGK